MKFEDFRRLPFLLPPAEEQRTIAAFLDYETARIDKLIAQQQRLIELLKEAAGGDFPRCHQRSEP
jgi:type I restriction enzyme S subunit